MFKPRNLYGTIGMIGVLIAIYLVLQYNDGFSKAVDSLSGLGGNLIQTLQARNGTATAKR